MRPCFGVGDVVPPLCKYSEIKDGTYSMYDILMFHIAMDEMIEAYEIARGS
jgi:hypothetical protein